MEGEDHQREYSESQTPHFFKIILNDTLRSGKLSFPKSFVRHHGKSLCLSKIYLRVSTGDVWELGLREEEDGYMWLLNGWQDFVEFYNIKFGYFLVFGYQGNSEFQVHIFDKTTLEIKYPCKPKKNKEHNADVDQCLFSVEPEIEEINAETLADHDASKIHNRKRHKDCMEKGSSGRGCTGSQTSPKPPHHEGSSRSDIQCAATRDHTSENPSFKFVMTKACAARWNARIPTGFSKHLKNGAQFATLEVAGRLWSVKVCFYQRRSNREGIFSSGWSNFVRENSLEVGDICMIELIDREEMVLKVSIHKATA